MSKTLAPNKTGWKIRTSSGFVEFHGIAKRGMKQMYRLSFDDDTHIDVTDKHRFFTPDGREIHTRELSIGLELLGTTNKTIVLIEPTQIEQSYDIIESGQNTYIANGLLCHNCEFLSSEALLVSSLWLANITSSIDKIKPIRTIKDVVFWSEIVSGKTYLVGVDPATGSGEDFSVITVFEFPSMVQVAEYRSNTMSTNDLYGILKNILLYLEKKETTIYFSVENNGVGEGVISLYEADETPPMTVEFVSEEGKARRGMTTTSRTKMRACVNLKEMLEKGNLHIKSATLLAELKSYARKRGAYAALPGSTDDVVSAVLIVIRLVEEIASYDQAAYDRLYAAQYDEWSQADYDGYEGGYDENDEGMPIII